MENNAPTIISFQRRAQGIAARTRWRMNKNARSARITSMRIEEAKAEAIRQFLFQCSVPIMVEQPEGKGPPAVLGTGTLFEINSKAYLVTAQHIFDDVDFNCVGVVAPRETSGPALTFQGSIVHKPIPLDRKAGPHYDVALIELRNPELIARLKSSWRFLGPSNIGVIGRTKFLVAGYPDVLTNAKCSRPGFRILRFLDRSARRFLHLRLCKA